MTIVSMALLAALVVSTIADVALASRLMAAKKREKEMLDARKRPVRRGKWIDHQEGRWIYAKCSECETVHDVRSNFCPNCGCAMEET